MFQNGSALESGLDRTIEDEDMRLKAELLGCMHEEPLAGACRLTAIHSVQHRSRAAWALCNLYLFTSFHRVVRTQKLTLRGYCRHARCTNSSPKRHNFGLSLSSPNCLVAVMDHRNVTASKCSEYCFHTNPRHHFASEILLSCAQPFSGAVQPSNSDRRRCSPPPYSSFCPRMQEAAARNVPHAY